MKKLNNHRSKPFGGWLGGALSVAVVLAGSPAVAEDLQPGLDSSLGSSPDVALRSIEEPDVSQLSTFANSGSTSGNLLVANFKATSFDAANFDAQVDEAGLNREGLNDERLNDESDRIADSSNLDEVTLNDQGDRVSDVSNESLQSASIAPALEEPVAAEVSTPSDPLVTQVSTEASSLAPLDAIAQADNSTSPSESSATASNRDWQFSVSPYFFAPFNVSADVTVSGRRTSLDLDLGDILNFDRVFDAGLRFEAQNDRLGLILDGFYVFAEDSGSLGRTFSSGSIFQFAQQTSPGRLQEFVQQFDPLQLQQAIQIGQQIGLDTPIRISADGTVSVRQIVVDAAVSYRVVDTSLDNSAEDNFYPRLAIAPILGIRTNSLRQTVEVDGIQINGREVPDRALPRLDREFRFSRTLVEPLLGAQFDLALSEQWSLGLRGDLSGFNIGARRNFTWNLIFGTQYNFSPNFALQLAYRFNHFEFETGEGFRETELSLSQDGLLLNAIFRF